MDSFVATFLDSYRWDLSLYTLLGIGLLAALIMGVSSLAPTVRAQRRLNSDAFKKKMEKPSYAANHKWNSKYFGPYLITVFGIILPFCLTLEAQPWWRFALDVVVVLMVYDFFYYLTHRFLFHDSALFAEGPLKWMHSVHHRQHNPCKRDSSYIHPLEVAIGMGLFVATIFFLSLVMGRFHVATVVITWVAFNQINIHNHALWEADGFPFKYLNYTAKMHHNHHGKFTGGNYATITLLYDWMFGTLDNGDGYGRHRKAARAIEQ